MLGSSRTVQTRRIRQAPPLTVSEHVSNFVRDLFRSKEGDQEGLVNEVSTVVENLSLKRIDLMNQKEKIDQEIYELARNNRPTKSKAMERQKVIAAIKGLDGRISVVTRNKNMLDNVETDTALAELIGKLNVYVGAQTKEGTDIAMLEEALDENDDYVGLEEKRNDQFNGAFERYNENMEQDMEEDDELKEIYALAAEQREIEADDEFPAIPREGQRETQKSATSSGRSGLTSSGNLQGRKQKAISWDDGWQ